MFNGAITERKPASLKSSGQLLETLLCAEGSVRPPTHHSVASILVMSPGLTSPIRLVIEHLE